jgi:hypothetical protein
MVQTERTYVPSKARTASSASLGSSNSTKANPAGFLNGFSRVTDCCLVKFLIGMKK